MSDILQAGVGTLTGSCSVAASSAKATMMVGAGALAP